IIDKVKYYKKGKEQYIALKGRMFIFLDKQYRVTDIVKHDLTESVFFKVGKVFSEFLSGPSRQIALLPIEILQYNPYQEKWEKKIARYLTWRWSTQARKSE